MLLSMVIEGLRYGMENPTRKSLCMREESKKQSNRIWILEVYFFLEQAMIANVFKAPSKYFLHMSFVGECKRTELI
jgi:hypothetical protein